MKKFLLKMTLLSFSIIIAMIVMELGPRLFFNEEGRRSVRYDRYLGWSGIPFGEGVYYYKEDNLNARYKFNELGFRDELISSLPDSSKRLVFLGDSFVESLEVDYDSTFHRRVELMLKNNINNNIDVINISSQNYGTAQEIMTLEKYRDIIHPYIVILIFYTGNDFDDNTRPRFATIDQNEILHWNDQRDSWAVANFKSLISWLYDKSHVIYVLRNFIQNKFNFKLLSNSAAGEKVKDSNGYEYKITKLLLMDLKEKLKAMKIPLGIVIIPGKDEIIAQNPLKSDFIAQICDKYHISYLNFYGLLKPAHYLKIDEHFNSEGHRIVTYNLYNFLVKNFLFDTNASNIQ